MHSKNLYKSATDCWSLAMFDRFRTVLLHVARNKMNSIHLPPEASDYAALDCLHLLINSNEKIRSTNFNVHSFYDFTNSSNKKIPWRKRHLDRKKPTTPRSSPSLLILLRLKTWMVWNLEKQIPCLTSGEDLFPPGGWRMDGGWYLVDLCVFWWFLMAILFTSILMKFFASAKTKGGGVGRDGDFGETSCGENMSKINSSVEIATFMLGSPYWGPPWRLVHRHVNGEPCGEAGMKSL